MKKLLGAYFTFTRTERAGILILLSMLLLLAGLRFAMKYIAATPVQNIKQEQLTAIWESRKSNAVTTEANANDIIDINTADSAALLSLKGIGPALTHRILEKRRELGHFSSYEQVWRVYKFSPETKQELLEKTVLLKNQH